MKIISKEALTKPVTQLLLFTLILSLAGCASVDPEPFSRFADSLQPLRQAVDTQMATAVTGSREELIQKVSDKDDPIIAPDLQLDFPASTHFVSRYGFGQDGEPKFVKFNRMRLGLSSLNDAVIAYARSLEMLAGGAKSGDILPSTTEFDQMARNLNTNAGTAAAALKLGTDPGKQALLSTAAIQLFKAFIENERRKDLVNAIGEVQPQIEAYSMAARQAVVLLAEVVKTNYTITVEPLLEAVPPNAVPILKLNDTTQTTLAMLQSMANSYQSLPAAHRDLKAAANRKTTGLAGIIALGEEASRLNGLVKQLAEVNVAAAATTTQ